MQKYTVCTTKGLVHTTDFESALKVLHLDLQLQQERKKKKAEEEKRKSQRWDEEFQRLLEQYTPKTQKELLQKKYEGGE